VGEHDLDLTRKTDSALELEGARIGSKASASTLKPERSVEESLELLRRLDHCLKLFKGAARARNQEHADANASLLTSAAEPPEKPQRRSKAAPARAREIEQSDAAASPSPSSAATAPAASPGRSPRNFPAKRNFPDSAPMVAPAPTRRRLQRQQLAPTEAAAFWEDIATAERPAVVVPLPQPSDKHTCPLCHSAAVCEMKYAMLEPSAAVAVTLVEQPSSRGLPFACVTCGAFFHGDCLAKSLRLPLSSMLLGDACVLTCAACVQCSSEPATPDGDTTAGAAEAPARASLERMAIPWEGLVRIAIANLTLTALSRGSGEPHCAMTEPSLAHTLRTTSVPLALSNRMNIQDESLWFTADDVCLFLEERWDELCQDKKPTHPWATTVEQTLKVKYVCSTRTTATRSFVIPTSMLWFWLRVQGHSQMCLSPAGGGAELRLLIRAANITDEGPVSRCEGQLQPTIFGHQTTTSERSNGSTTTAAAIATKHGPSALERRVVISKGGEIGKVISAQANGWLQVEPDDAPGTVRNFRAKSLRFASEGADKSDVNGEARGPDIASSGAASAVCHNEQDALQPKVPVGTEEKACGDKYDATTFRGRCVVMFEGGGKGRVIKAQTNGWLKIEPDDAPGTVLHIRHRSVTIIDAPLHSIQASIPASVPYDPDSFDGRRVVISEDGAKGKVISAQANGWLQIEPDDAPGTVRNFRHKLVQVMDDEGASSSYEKQSHKLVSTSSGEPSPVRQNERRVAVGLASTTDRGGDVDISRKRPRAEARDQESTVPSKQWFASREVEGVLTYALTPGGIPGVRALASGVLVWAGPVPPPARLFLAAASWVPGAVCIAPPPTLALAVGDLAWVRSRLPSSSRECWWPAVIEMNGLLQKRFGGGPAVTARRLEWFDDAPDDGSSSDDGHPEGLPERGAELSLEGGLSTSRVTVALRGAVAAVGDDGERAAGAALVPLRLSGQFDELALGQRCVACTERFQRALVEVDAIEAKTKAAPGANVDGPDSACASNAKAGAEDWSEGSGITSGEGDAPQSPEERALGVLIRLHKLSPLAKSSKRG